MKKIIIMAESGSDLTRELAAQYGIEIVPMHVTFENESLDDGTFEFPFCRRCSISSTSRALNGG